ncbi:uncharacterized protein LODBEIA_P19000 [Lodderomyces beijingensis]|uniref:Uncharacterized protein n=1 Tax=Lodderomyces beijingensis TaxID=1775926 RepID=A0ABP0ZHP7_9ASCO
MTILETLPATAQLCTPFGFLNVGECENLLILQGNEVFQFSYDHCKITKQTVTNHLMITTRPVIKLRDSALDFIISSNSLVLVRDTLVKPKDVPFKNIQKSFKVLKFMDVIESPKNYYKLVSILPSFNLNGPVMQILPPTLPSQENLGLFMQFLGLTISHSCIVEEHQIIFNNLSKSKRDQLEELCDSLDITYTVEDGTFLIEQSWSEYLIATFSATYSTAETCRDHSTTNDDETYQHSKLHKLEEQERRIFSSMKNAKLRGHANEDEKTPQPLSSSSISASSQAGNFFNLFHNSSSDSAIVIDSSDTSEITASRPGVVTEKSFFNSEGEKVTIISSDSESENGSFAKFNPRSDEGYFGDLSDGNREVEDRNRNTKNFGLLRDDVSLSSGSDNYQVESDEESDDEVEIDGGFISFINSTDTGYYDTSTNRDPEKNGTAFNTDHILDEEPSHQNHPESESSKFADNKSFVLPPWFFHLRPMIARELFRGMSEGDEFDRSLRLLNLELLEEISVIMINSGFAPRIRHTNNRRVAEYELVCSLRFPPCTKDGYPVYRKSDLGITTYSGDLFGVQLKRKFFVARFPLQNEPGFSRPFIFPCQAILG